MELRCSCGARPPEDARFCHKCGRPLYEPVPDEDEEARLQQQQLAEAQPTTPPPLPAAPVEISFRNGYAVRAGFWAAAAACLLAPVQFPIPLEYLWIAMWSGGAGFLSVWLYQRHTREKITPRGGVRIGWITGVFVFCIVTVVLTVTVITLAQDQDLIRGVIKQMQERGMPEASTKQFQEALSTPGVLGMALLLCLPLWFVFSTVLSVTGGLLGARLLRTGNSK